MNKNQLKLHEAIAVVLLGKPDRTATFQEIADEINLRGLYHRKDGANFPAYQVKMRATLAKGQYHHLFELAANDSIKLKNTPTD